MQRLQLPKTDAMHRNSNPGLGATEEVFYAMSRCRAVCLSVRPAGAVLAVVSQVGMLEEKV